MKKVTYNIAVVLVILFSAFTFAQQYSGPAQGSVSSGIIVTTDDFSMPVGGDQTGERRVIEVQDPDFGMLIDQTAKQVYDNYVYVEDENAYSSPTGGGIGTSFELNSFSAIPMTNSIPPDPHMAVGPNHVIAMVNTRFYIYDRDGNVLKNISADAWCGQVLPNPGAFDPQIIYDHYEGRWFMLWDNQNNGTQTAFFIIAFSDDEDPLGTWYMYAINAKTNGNNNTNTWGDYPQIGYDDQAIYIMSRQFTFGGSYLYNKIRIINKAELYAAQDNGFTWQDIWSIRDPGNASSSLDVIHPTISYDAGLNRSYFVWANRQGGNYYVLYWIDDPVGSPTLSGVRITVPTYGPAPKANQLGGGNPRLESGGSSVRNAPILRDGKIYAVHAIRNSQFSQNGSIKYFVIDANTHAILEQVEQGAQGYYYIYPAIAVDADHNLAITYSRSADTEYIGAFYSTKRGTDAPGLSPSKVMMEGQGNYVVTFGGSRNRWGDYLMASLDPVNQANIWLFSEYAAATNTWGTWLTEIRMKPYSGVSLFTESNPVEFGELEIGSSPLTKVITIANYGDSPLVINNITPTAGPFTLLTSLNYPVTLNTFDSLDLEIQFDPVDPAIYSELMAFDDNDPNFDGLILNGTAFLIEPAFTGFFYASTGTVENGVTITVNKSTGEGTLLGPSNFDDLNSITADPVTSVLYGVSTTSNTTELVRINGTGGDAFTQHTLDVGNVVGVTFDSSGTMYIASQIGIIYTVDLSNGTISVVDTADIQLTAIEIDPTTNVMYAVKKIVIGSGKDNIYTIDLTTGTSTLVGLTGFGVKTNDLAFDENGDLYGIIGGDNDVAQLISINKNDGSGTLVGDINFTGVLGLAYAVNGNVSSVNPDEKNTSVPGEFVLSQNYPNPFNPTTVINFSVPVESNVTITIYNMLGQTVATIVNQEVTPGNYTVTWNGTDDSGLKVSSGIYLYELRAAGNNGSNFVNTKKMILLK